MRDPSQNSVPSLLDVLNEGYCVLHMRNLPKSHRENAKKKQDRFDTLSIPNNVIKKGPFHRARHGNTERQQIYHVAHVAAKKARKIGQMYIPWTLRLKCSIR